MRFGLWVSMTAGLGRTMKTMLYLALTWASRTRRGGDGTTAFGSRVPFAGAARQSCRWLTDSAS